MIRFGPDVCGNLDAALRREWLETNGLGGFASSTIVGLNARRYHGLLVAATEPPVGRYVLLSKLEETLLLDGRVFDLSANRYGAVVHPQGFHHLKQFRLDPFPIFTYEIDGIEKTVFMLQGENSTMIQYRLGNKSGSKSLSQKIEIELRPLIAFRDYHGTTHENWTLNSTVKSGPESGRSMWARVKGRTENALLQMPFKAVFLFRPAYIQPLHGIRTKTRWYGAAYSLMRPLYPLWKTLFPNYVTTTEYVGRAMLNVTKRGFTKPVLENRDINRMCG